ncbi:hypothetical protein F8M41_026477 [Gigaspora margarita]|uniref:Uncharacterized protein n=1 Tax=Gigaspora margarita TaxID=4874 RepID=A0A8H3XHD7_GIGMA|nr:hypothetical protein F8M41_026477 [Gigaspora margarita]
MNAVLEFEELVLDGIKSSIVKSWSRKNLKRIKTQYSNLPKNLERSHSCEIDEIDDNLGWYYWDRTEAKKGKRIREKDKLDRLENLTKIDPASYKVLEEFDKRKEKIETVPTEPRKIANVKLWSFL